MLKKLGDRRSTNIARAVLLFRTWYESEYGPIVTPDQSVFVDRTILAAFVAELLNPFGMFGYAVDSADHIVSLLRQRYDRADMATIRFDRSLMPPVSHAFLRAS
eukprot:Opistho-2@68149